MANLTGLILCFTLMVASPSAQAQKTELIPVVFAHGIFMNGKTIGHWKSLQTYFAQRGYKLLSANTLPSSAYEKRAAALNAEIKRLVPEGPFHIVAHSGGGIDARLGIFTYGWGNRALSLTTISTPHHGSFVGDRAISLVDKYTHDNFLTDFFFFKVFPNEIDVTRGMTTKNMEVFNRNVTDDPRVKYYSLGASIKPPVAPKVIIPLLWWGHQINVDYGDIENDGLVSPRSSRWGTYLGTVEADHASVFLNVKYGGTLVYPEVYKIILDNLDRQFGKK
jgi:triacylglycerol lipase